MSRKYSKNKNHKKSDHSETLKGVLDITRSGMGFVIVENSKDDVLVRPSDFGTAMHGDTVRVKVRGDQSRTGRRQGEITEVVKRKQLEFMGRIDISQNFAFFIVNSDKPVPDIYVPINKLNGAQNGDQAVVKIIEWEKNKKPVGEIIQVMDSSDVNDQAMKEILIENGFPLMFPDSVIEESERIPDKLAAAEISKRRDFREVLTFTIDPVDAKDFDDAISFQVIKNGNYEVGVHIADVSYYVEPGTELDREAFERATSVYLPDRVSPMLPERISNELCSLRPNEDKFTFAAVFEITPDGVIKNQWLGRTVIHSNHRYTYEDAQQIIETGEGIYKDEILLLNELAKNYRRQRFKKGAINFSSQEVRFKLDEKGKPIGIVIKESKEAHQLIEEFMLLANRAVAEVAGKVTIEKEPIPFPYRVHDTPDEAKLTPFITFAKKYGHSFDISSPEEISKSFNQMLEDVKGKPEQHVLEQLGIRTMAKAIYTTENIGHYGLGFEHYCHFTSPIRRYPDILVHRILQEVLDKSVKPDKKLEQKCKHCSDKERSAMESERAANKYKQVEYMQEFLGEEFEGVISGVSSFGFWVETVQHKCEGLVSINNLQDYDDFRLIEGEYCLVGLRSGRKFRMGDKVNIKVVAANLDKRQLDYEWVLPGADTGLNPALTVAAEETGSDGTGNVDLPVRTENRKGDLGFRGGDRNNRGNERNNRKDKDKRGGNRGQGANRNNQNSDFDRGTGSRDRQKPKGDKAPYSGRPWSQQQAKPPKFDKADEPARDYKKHRQDPQPKQDAVQPDRYKAEWDEFLSKQPQADTGSDAGDKKADPKAGRKQPALAKKTGAPVTEKIPTAAKAVTALEAATRSKEVIATNEAAASNEASINAAGSIKKPFAKKSDATGVSPKASAPDKTPGNLNSTASRKQKSAAKKQAPKKSSVKKSKKEDKPAIKQKSRGTPPKPKKPKL